MVNNVIVIILYFDTVTPIPLSWKSKTMIESNPSCKDYEQEFMAC